MLRLPAFEFVAARTVDEAVGAWQGASGAMYVAGGTDLVPNMKRRQFEPPRLVGLRRIEDLRGRGVANGATVLGAGLTLRQLAVDEHVGSWHRALQEAAAQVANLQIQRVATLGGNLCVDTRCNYYNQTFEWRQAVGFCMKKDGDICLVAPGSSKCWAVSSSDTAPALAALGAEVELAGVGGKRRIPLLDLYQDDGIAYLTRRPDEILTRVIIPRMEGLRSTYVKVRRRGSFDFPILGIGAALRTENGRVTHARLALGAVHTHPLSVPEAADLLVGHEPTLERIDAVAEAAYKRSTPLDNTDLTLYWRKRVVRVQVRRALAGLAGISPA